MTVETKTTSPALIMGIESSCDETAVAIVSQDKKILSNIVLSQFDDHSCFTTANVNVENVAPLLWANCWQAKLQFASKRGLQREAAVPQRLLSVTEIDWPRCGERYI